MKMQSFATARSVFLWAQLKGDPLQALLNSSEVIRALQSRILQLPSLLRLLKEPTGGGQGAAVLTATGRLAVSRFLSPQHLLSWRLGLYVSLSSTSSNLRGRVYAGGQLLANHALVCCI